MPSIGEVASQLLTASLVPPASHAAGTNNGTGVDILLYEGVIECTQNIGALTGSMTSKIQDSADNASFADVTSQTASFAVGAANTPNSLKLDTRALRRYIRYVDVVTGGPILISATVTGVKKYRP